MAVRLISVRCPECGQILSVEENRRKLFCSYCGANVLIDNDNERTIRTIDEAGIQKAETEKLVKLRELDLEEQNNKENARLRRILTYVWLGLSLIILGYIIIRCLAEGELTEDTFALLVLLGAPVIGGGAALIFYFMPLREKESKMAKTGGIRFPEGLTPFSERQYSAVEAGIRSAGFINVQTVNLHDLNIFTALVNNGKVEKVTINGREAREKRMYMPEDAVVITYHGK